jgi:DNA-binding transcriptional regulator LsrR (DeoR family)
MPRSRTSPSLLAQIAWLHYHQGLSQTQIADHLGLSKMVISRSLRRAFDLGIVSVSIVSPFARDSAPGGGARGHLPGSPLRRHHRRFIT